MDTRTLVATVVAAAAALAPVGPPSRAQQQQLLPPPSPAPREVERIVKDYLLREPEVIQQAVQELQRRQQAAEADRQRAVIAQRRDEIFAAAGDPVGGNPAGDVTLVEFLDYACGYCRAMAAGVQALLEQDTGLRFVVKDFPILGEGSAIAARAALAAERQRKHAALHPTLLQVKELNRDTVLQAAAEVGLDAGRLARDMDDPAIAARLERNRALAGALGINGTPAFVVGDRVVAGATGIENLAKLVHEQRDAATAAN